jgi:hypothetical protein
MTFLKSFTQEMQMTCTAWVESLNTSNHSRKKTNRSCQKHEYYWWRSFFTNTGRHLLGVSFITSIKSNLHTALTAENTTANNCIILHTQDTTELHTNVFLTGIARLLVTKDGRLSPVQVNYKLHSHYLYFFVVSYNFTVNIISNICNQTTSSGHYYMQDDEIRRLLLPWRYSPRWAKASFFLGFRPEGFPSR